MNRRQFFATVAAACSAVIATPYRVRNVPGPLISYRGWVLSGAVFRERMRSGDWSYNVCHRRWTFIGKVAK